MIMRAYLNFLIGQFFNFIAIIQLSLGTLWRVFHVLDSYPYTSQHQWSTTHLYEGINDITLLEFILILQKKSIQLFG